MKQQSPLWTEFLEYIEDNSSETKKILEGSSQRDDEETDEVDYYTLMDCVYTLEYYLRNSPKETRVWVRIKSLLREEYGVRL